MKEMQRVNKKIDWDELERKKRRSMTQFKSLSEKSHRNAYEDTPDLDNQYDEKDIKEFIRLLKEEIEEPPIDNESIIGFSVQNIRFNRILDKLAGGELI